MLILPKIGQDLGMAGSSFVYPPPTDGKPFRLMMGLRTMPTEQWIETGDDLLAQLPQRTELIDKNRDIVFAQLPGFENEVELFARLIISNLKSHHQDFYQVVGDSKVIVKSTGFEVEVFADHPFIQLCKVIGEDLCLISKVADQWLLTSAVVVYPSRWRLQEKIGKNLDQIHQPVPGYETALQPAMSLTFDKLTSDRQVWRLNWALHSEPELHQPSVSYLSQNPENYWWRTERQTLTKLAGTEHVLFTIRNRVERLSQIHLNPIHALAFADTLKSMTPETVAYKGLTSDHQAIVDYLSGR